jgi:phage baseplate assembly protein V
MSLFDDGNEHLKEAMAEMFRVGVVHSINPQKGTVRVRFPDDDDVVSYDLQVMHRNTYKNKDYNMPDIGEDVLCLFISNGMADGFVLGSVYAGDRTPPENTENKRTVVFSDDTKVSYDRDLHDLDIEIAGTKITANRKLIRIDTPLEVEVTTGDVTVNAAKMHVNGVLGTSTGATGIITPISVATVVNGIVTGIY